MQAFLPGPVFVTMLYWRDQEFVAWRKHGLEIQEKYLPPQDRGIASTLNTLANLYREERKFTNAKPVYERILASEEKDLGLNDPGLLPTLSSYADILRGLHDDAGVAEVQARINLLQLIQNQSGRQKSSN